MRRILVPALAALAISACRSADSFAPRDPLQQGPVTTAPIRPTVSGTWAGSVSGAALVLTISHDSPTGAITGGGSLSGNDASLPLTVMGTYATPTVSLTISSIGYKPMNFTGTHASGTISGTLNGSGFENAATTLTKR